MASSVLSSEVKTIVLACEAGMGSSLMSVSALKKKLKKANIQGVTVVHAAAREIPANVKLIIVHKGLAKFVHKKMPEAVVVSFTHFFNDPIFDELVEAFTLGTEIVSTEE